MNFARKRKNWASFIFYVCAKPFINCLICFFRTLFLRAYAYGNYATVDIHPKGGFPLSRNFFSAYARKVREAQLLPLSAAFHELPFFFINLRT